MVATIKLLLVVVMLGLYAVASAVGQPLEDEGRLSSSCLFSVARDSWYLSNRQLALLVSESKIVAILVFRFYCVDSRAFQIR